jgi:2-amino-4-hydroxy-6-hydroxymethyldihydropteridine diphosphokinase
MPRVWVSIGSNIERERHIRGALEALRKAFGELVVSPVYESAAVGFDGAPFYNLVAGFFSDRPPLELALCLRAIEEAHGRLRDGAKFSSRTLDIDLLTLGDQVVHAGKLELPRDEILKYAFVLRPLADVAPEERHPLVGRSYRELWQSFDQGSQPLWPAAGFEPAP